MTHRLPLGAVAELVLNALLGQCLAQVELQHPVLARVVAQQGLLVLPREVALGVGAGVGSTVGEDLVDALLEVLHDQVVLLLAILVLGLRLKAAELAGVRRAKAVGVLGQPHKVQHHVATVVTTIR